MTPKAALLLPSIALLWLTGTICAEPRQVDFIVAGHTYGHHVGDNAALYGPFLDALARRDLAAFDFMILTGDFVRMCDQPALDQLERELSSIPLETYVVMGNHEETTALCRPWVKERHGDTFYRFERGGAHFIVLDSEKEERSISPDQLAFLRDSLGRCGEDAVVFVFFHELLWLSKGIRYRYVRANRRSRQANVTSSNYWQDVHPILLEHPRKRIFVIAGDVGGNPDAIPAFYEEVDHVTLIASGMGEAIEGNYLEVRVDRQAVSFSLVALDPADEPLAPLESFSPANLSRLDARGLPLPRWVLLRRWVRVRVAWVSAGLAALALCVASVWARRRLRRA